jgi:FMN-dependent oxidoreductase (nitrilotriacetate monooxygenase family)
MNQPKKPILVNAFTMNSVGHIHQGLWTHPRDESSRYHTLSYWTNTARILEHGLFDGIFIADVLGYYDVYQGNADLTLRESIQLPSNDPWTLVSAMAAVTEHLGFGVTATVRAENPYAFSRRVSSLDHLTNGRLGWNIVTGHLDSTARALSGEARLESHDARYDRADDFLEFVYKLWEGSWQDDAVVIDKSGRVFTDPKKVRAIWHDGAYYRGNAIHLCQPSPQRTPVLFQAGTSGRGLRFAGKHAEGVFIWPPDKERARQASRALREAARESGRHPEDIRIFAGIAVVTGETNGEARDKYEEYMRYSNTEAALAHFSAATGIDFSRYDLDEPIDYGVSNAIQSAQQNVERKGLLTRRQLLEAHGNIGSRAVLVVGDGRQVADELEAWVEEGEIDGFNLTRIVVPETWEDFSRFVVPELQNRGRFKTTYREGALRHKLFGQGNKLPERHPGARFRHG